MVATALIMLVCQLPTWWFACPVALIMCREIGVSALREWMAGKSQYRNTFSLIIYSSFLFYYPITFLIYTIYRERAEKQCASGIVRQNKNNHTNDINSNASRSLSWRIRF